MTVKNSTEIQSLILSIITGMYLIGNHAIIHMDETENLFLLRVVDNSHFLEAFLKFGKSTSAANQQQFFEILETFFEDD